MARPLRYNPPGGIHHITSRGIEKRDIVRDDADRYAFVELLADVVLDRKWILQSWILMTNHLHLVIETPVPNLSAGMRDLLGGFAARFNKVHRRIGHLFQHRFDAKPVERESHLLELLRYVPLNPVRCGLVNNPSEWRWGSYRATAGFEAVPPWLEVGWTLDQFDPSNRLRARALFREFVSHARQVEYNPHTSALEGWILGSPSFSERVQKWIDAEERSREHPKRQRRVVLVSMEALIDTVRRETGVGQSALTSRNYGPARKLIADLGHEECGLTFGAIAEVLSTSAWGAGKLRRRSQQLAGVDRAYARLRERVRSVLIGRQC